MKFEILTACHNYKKRILWHLESIQRNLKYTNVKSSVVVCNKSHERYILRYFPNVKVIRVDTKTFSKRAHSREIQIQALDKDTEIVMFADCDQVYDENYFSLISNKIKSYKNFADTNCIAGFSRISWPEKFAHNVIESYNWKNIEDVFSVIKNSHSVLPQGLRTVHANRVGYRTTNVCAGYCQMVHVNNLQGRYLHKRTKDGCLLTEGGVSTKSDIQFRRQFDKILKWEIKGSDQYHLNHFRDIGLSR